MINYDKNVLELMATCDACGEETEFIYGDFKECVDILKQKGWKTFKNDYDEWRHECPQCAKGPTAQEDFG